MQHWFHKSELYFSFAGLPVSRTGFLIPQVRKHQVLVFCAKLFVLPSDSYFSKSYKCLNEYSLCRDYAESKGLSYIYIYIYIYITIYPGGIYVGERRHLEVIGTLSH